MNGINLSPYAHEPDDARYVPAPGEEDGTSSGGVFDYYDMSRGPLFLTNKIGLAVATDLPEPTPSSIVLVHGLTGTGWQRTARDEGWERLGGGRTRDWAWLTRQPRLVLVHLAPLRSHVWMEDMR